MITQAGNDSNTPTETDDLIFADIQSHESAWEALLETLGSKDETAPKLAIEDARITLVDLVTASRKLMERGQLGLCVPKTSNPTIVVMKSAKDSA
jgi:hypothetical protein